MRFLIAITLIGKLFSLNTLGSDIQTEYYPKGTFPPNLCYDIQGLSSSTNHCLRKFKCDSYKKLKKLDRVFSFGDSFTDDGNVYKLLNQTYPNPEYYCSGKYSNGKMWINYLIDKLQTFNKDVELINLAYGGATSNNNLTYTNLNRPSVDDQIRKLLSPYLQKDNSGSLKNSLFIVWLAGNDYLDNKIVPQQVVNELTKTLTYLVNDIKAQNVLVGLMVPLQSLPYYMLGNNTALIEIHNKNWRLHNQLLKESIDKLKNISSNRNLKLGFFKPAPTFQSLLNSKSINGNRWNSTHPCLDDVSLPQSYEKKGLGKDSWTCKFPEQHMFWDDFHPATYVHKKLAERALKDLKVLLG